MSTVLALNPELEPLPLSIKHAADISNTCREALTAEGYTLTNCGPEGMYWCKPESTFSLQSRMSQRVVVEEKTATFYERVKQWRAREVFDITATDLCNEAMAAHPTSTARNALAAMLPHHETELIVHLLKSAGLNTEITLSESMW